MKISGALTVYALVLNWNRPEDTLECLESLVNQRGVTLKVLVVDNGSTDDSVERIRRHYPKVEIIASTENLRFAGGANLGFRYALDHDADYVFFINNDAFVADDALSVMLAHVTPETGLLAPMIYYADAPNHIWSIGGKLIGWLLEHTNDARWEVDQGNFADVIEQDFVSGCCLLIPRQTLDRVGLLDDKNFRMYYEDSDFSFRVRQAGLRIQVITKAKVWHKVSLSSGGSDSPDERYWMAKSSMIYFRKHAHLWQWPFIIFWRMGSAFRTTLRLIARKRLVALKSYWLGLWDGLQENLV